MARSPILQYPDGGEPQEPGGGGTTGGEPSAPLNLSFFVGGRNNGDNSAVMLWTPPLDFGDTGVPYTPPILGAVGANTQETYGYPTDDTALALPWLVIVPDSSVFGAGPYPALICLHGGGFHGGGPGPLLQTCGYFSARGYLAVSIQTRLTHPIPGQVSNGKYPYQHRDGMLAVKAMKADPRCNGFIAWIGWSAGGSVGIHCAADTNVQTLGKLKDNITAVSWAASDRVNCAVTLSAPNQYDDRTAINYGVGLLALYVADIEDYTGTAVLATQAADSPNAIITSTVKPLLIRYSDEDTIPNLGNPLVAKLVSVGATNYAYKLNHGTLHNGDYSQATMDENYRFIEAVRAGTWNGTVPAATDNGLTDFVPYITGGNVNVDQILGTEHAAIIYGLDYDTVYTGTLAAVNRRGAGPASIAASFRSNRILGGGVVTGKPEPAGNFTLVPNPVGSPFPDQTGKLWWDYAYVDGMRARMGWGDIEPLEGQFTWLNPTTCPITKLLTLASSKGKLVGLSIAAGIVTPKFVRDAGMLYFNETGGPKPSVYMPFVWNSIYIDKLKNFIRALGNQFDGHPALSYVVMSGFAQLIETYFVATPTDYALALTQAQIDLYADVGTAWVDAGVQITDSWYKAFPTTIVLTALANPVNKNNGGTQPDAALDQYVQQSFFGNGGQQIRPRMGLTSSGLTGLSNTSFEPNKLIHDNSDKIVLDGTGHPAGFQFAYASGNPACDPTQVGTYDEELGLRNTITAGLNLGARYLEFYERDVLYGEAVGGNPVYVTDLLNAQTALKA